MIRREKREYKRVPVALEAQLVSIHHDVASTTLQGPKMTVRVTNLSPMGLSVKLSDTYRIGVRFLVRMELDGCMIAFFAAVRRVYPSTEFAATLYGHGLQIIAADEEAIGAICKYISGRSGNAAPPPATPGQSSPTKQRAQH